MRTVTFSLAHTETKIQSFSEKKRKKNQSAEIEEEIEYARAKANQQRDD